MTVLPSIPNDAVPSDAVPIDSVPIDAVPNDVVPIDSALKYRSQLTSGRKRSPSQVRTRDDGSHDNG